MKKLLSLFILTLLPMLASAQTASDVQNSGCLSKTRGEEAQMEPTIILTKEGSTLSVQLLNYESNCATQDFNVSSSINGEGGIYGVSVDINPVLPELVTSCLCPFNISFTIHDMEPNNFYFNCWWYKGQVELTEGEPMVMAYKTDVKINEENFPDENFRKYLLGQEYGEDGVLTEDEIARVTFVNLLAQNIIAKGNIHSLKGIEYFTAMTKLICSRNELTELDLSKNTALTWLECYGNHLTELNLSKNTELTYLDCQSNELTALNVSGCTKLTELNCFGNQLTKLNVSGCSALTILKCYLNLLMELDVSGCTSLTTMWVFDNQLPVLDVSDCNSLSDLRCDNNQLTQLDVSKNTMLAELRCEDNLLTALNLSKNKNLNSLRTYHNPIKGEAMDVLIESLPTVSNGGWCVVLSKNEEDVVTTTQVAAAKAKGWTSYYWNEAAKSWMEYAGSTHKDDYRPLVEEGKVWTYSYNNGRRQYMKSLTVSGDTIIGNQTYKKIVDVASQAVEMALREEGKKVYCCYPNQNTEYLLYDFGKNAGEVISKEIIYGNTRIRKVISVNTIMVKNNAFRCMTVHEYTIPEGMSEEEYFAGNYGYDSGFWVEGIGSFKYLDTPIPYDGNYYTFQECRIGDVTFKQKDFVAMPQNDYRPFVEEGKVWKVGTIPTALDSPVQVVDYYYFDGDTIIGGKTCKQMMCQRYVSPNYSNEYWTPRPFLTKVGAWYEEDKKVYSFDERQQTMTLKYDFSLEANDTLHFLNVDDYPPFIIGPKQTGGIEGFKGVYRDIMMCRDEGQNIRNTTWLEGVGVRDAPFRNAYDPRADLVPEFLISCTVGDEVIYLNDRYEDGATPESMGARKNRFDFTHTIKTKPKAPMRREGEMALYGEYSLQQLAIHLNPLDDAYLVRITDETGKDVYQKAINAGSIVGLNIDISAYEKGRYTVTVENSNESFTGEFEAQTTGIEAISYQPSAVRHHIYNLQGQRLSTLQKGLNIVNGQKIYVK